MKCKRCLIDSKIDLVTLTDEGCELCENYLNRLKQTDVAKENLISEKIRAESLNQKYNCVLGLSGGTDSSYAALWAKKHNLSGLLIHLDNGWNSDLASKNIETIQRITAFPLVTVVLNWENFRAIQKAFFVSGLRELEFPTDHAIKYAVYSQAKKKKVKSIISGRNLVTEGILPSSWSYGPLDNTFLKSVLRAQSVKLDPSFPTQNLPAYLFDRILGSYKEYFPLNHDAGPSSLWKEKLLSTGWSEYSQKHYESNWTKFYQGVYMFEKYGIDKRRAHLSVQVLRGEISRTEANEALLSPPVDDQERLILIEYVKEKLQLTEREFNLGMSTHRSFKEFKNLSKFFELTKSSAYIKVRKHILT